MPDALIVHVESWYGMSGYATFERAGLGQLSLRLDTGQVKIKRKDTP